MTDVMTENQREVNHLAQRAMFNAIVWVCGIGSLRAILYARKALRMIATSSAPLSGGGKARLAHTLGVIGVSIWIPFIIIGIVVSSINR